jgi:D-serine deaminase-like pyridoxal phosphate-dependent protein
VARDAHFRIEADDRVTAANGGETPADRIRRIPVPSLPSGLDTPCLVVDLDAVERNLERMAQAMEARGIALRPHVKTHKSIALARMQLEHGARGLTVGTIGEAEVLVQAGFDDIFIAYSLWTSDAKGARLRALLDRGPLRVGADSVAGVERLAASVRGTAHAPVVLVELDSGELRTGVTPDAVVEVAEAARRAGLEVAGVFTHGGHAYAGPDAVGPAAADEVDLLTVARDRLRAAGFEAPVVSAGSTPTVLRSATGAVTEERPGTYIFNDRQQVGLRGAPPDGIALVVAATVVSVAIPGQVVIDAGGKTLAKDRPAWADGFASLPAYPEATIVRTYDYHGVVAIPAGTPRPSLGEVVAVVPNHVCPVVNLSDSFVVSRGGSAIDRWPVDARGRSS